MPTPRPNTTRRRRRSRCRSSGWRRRSRSRAAARSSTAPSYSLVDAAYAPFLQRYFFLDRVKKLGHIEKFPRLKAWGEALLARPSTHSFPRGRIRGDVSRQSEAPQEMGVAIRRADTGRSRVVRPTLASAIPGGPAARAAAGRRRSRKISGIAVVVSPLGYRARDLLIKKGAARHLSLLLRSLAPK